MVSPLEASVGLSNRGFLLVLTGGKTMTEKKLPAATGPINQFEAVPHNQCVSDSLSFGMRDAVDPEAYTADDVVFVTACNFETEEQLEEIIARYLEVYWKKCPEAADAARKAWREGRIIVPRAHGYCCPIGAPGQPLWVNFEEWKTEVANHAPEWSMGWCPRNCEVTREQVLATQTIQELYQLFPKGDENWR